MNRAPLIEKILNDFNFEKIQEYMREKRWYWDGKKVPPSIKQMQDTARYLLENVNLRGDGGYLATGGFEAYITDRGLSLAFRYKGTGKGKKGPAYSVWAYERDCTARTEIGPRTKDLSGITYGDLTAVGLARYRYDYTPVWKVQCLEGHITEVAGNNLKQGTVTTCRICRKAREKRVNTITVRLSDEKFDRCVQNAKSCGYDSVTAWATEAIENAIKVV